MKNVIYISSLYDQYKGDIHVMISHILQEIKDQRKRVEYIQNIYQFCEIIQNNERTQV